MSLMRKIPITVASLVASSTLFAAMDMDSRVTQLETQMKQVRTETAMGTFGAKTASARPEVDGNGFFIQGDVLYWHAKAGGTEFAYSDQNSQAQFPLKGTTQSMNFDWDWGFRLGAGYNFEHDGWDLHLQYTWFDTNANAAAQAGLNDTVVPLSGSAALVDGSKPTFTSCDNAKSQYSFDFQSLDLELGRAFFVSRSLSLRPHWGLKSAWVDQDQETRYSGGSILGNNTVKVKDKCDFWGLGPRAGFDSKWHLGSGFSLFGNVSGALLFGHFDVNHKEHLSSNDNNSVHINGDRHAFSPNVQLQLGLVYDIYVHDNKQHIGVGLGFDAQYWWRQNQMLKIDDASVLKYERHSDDVSMHGVTLDVKWDF